MHLFSLRTILMVHNVLLESGAERKCHMSFFGHTHCNLAIRNIIPGMNVTTNPEGVIETPTVQNVSHLTSDKQTQLQIMQNYHCMVSICLV